MSGSRKLKQTREAQLVLLAGFLAATVTDVPAEVFTVFAIAVAGNLGTFSWANVRVHQSAGNEGAVNGPPPKTG